MPQRSQGRRWRGNCVASCLWTGHVEMVKMLIERNCDVNQATKDGRTPLIVASEEGHETLVEYLIKGCGLQGSNEGGKTALYNACERGHVNIASMLLEAGQTRRNKLAGRRSLFTLPRSRVMWSSWRSSFRLRKSWPVRRDNVRNDPLFIATKSGSAEVKDLLVAFCSRGEKPKRKKVTASLAKAPSTPRFMTDVDPVGEKKQKFKRGVSRKSSVDSDEIDFGDKDERLRLKDAEAHAKREKELKRRSNDGWMRCAGRGAWMAENARKEERRRNFEESMKTCRMATTTVTAGWDGARWWPRNSTTKW